MIDWFTTAAQIINFLILVALLRYFLYGRIVNAMDERQASLQRVWDEAHQALADAQKAREEAQRERAEIAQQRQQMMADVAKEVEQYRTELIAEVRREADAMRKRWAASIAEESESFLKDLKRRATEEVCQITRRVFADLADATLEEQIVRLFLARLNELSPEQREAIVETVRQGDRKVVVQSAFPLSDQIKQQIESTLQDQIDEQLAIEFELEPDLICGIALQTNAHAIAWNVSDYLGTLEASLRQTIEEESVVRDSRTLQGNPDGEERSHSDQNDSPASDASMRETREA